MSTKITFRERGAGPPLILLHGYGGSVHHWEHIAELLKDSYRVLVPNMSHLYMSTEMISLERQVDLLAEFIRQQCPHEQVSLAGMSYGGCLSWIMGLRHPELLSRLVLINPLVVNPVNAFALSEMKYFFSLPVNLKAMYFLLSTPFGKVFLKKAAQVFRDERSAGVVNVETLKGRKLQFVAHMISHFSWILRNANWTDWQRQMKMARVETLMVFDCEDLLFKAESYREFAKSYHCERVIEMTGAGHTAIKSRPETIARAMRDFIGHRRSKSA